MVKELNKINQSIKFNLKQVAMETPIISRKEALKIITQNKNGNIDDLKDKIGESFVREFELIGYIVRGHSNKGLNTWRASDSSYKTWGKVYSEPSFIEKGISLFLARVLQIR